MKIDAGQIVSRYSIPDWDNVKPELLKAIYHPSARGFGTQGRGGPESRTTIYETNYFNAQHGYLYGESPIVHQVLTQFFDHICRTRGVATSFNGNIWHQIYARGDSHDWHTHAPCNMASVIYIECPNENCGTEFNFGWQRYKPSVKEGEIITFPPSILHRSGVHDADEHKIVMSFNWDISGAGLIKKNEDEE
jgi:hypothetical protein